MVPDLIDTLWNVKEDIKVVVEFTDGDLIDTLWNVKKKSGKYAKSWTRFNRYIVECKGVHHMQSVRRKRDLIDTLWNVKLVPYAVYYEDDTGFNRYIVECKGHTKRKTRG